MLNMLVGMMLMMHTRKRVCIMSIIPTSMLSMGMLLMLMLLMLVLH